MGDDAARVRAGPPNQKEGPALTPCYQGLRCRQRPKLRAVLLPREREKMLGGVRPRQGRPLLTCHPGAHLGERCVRPTDGPGSGRPAVRGGLFSRALPCLESPHQQPKHTTDLTPRAQPGQAVASLSQRRPARSGPKRAPGPSLRHGHYRAGFGRRPPQGGQGAPPVDASQQPFFYGKPGTNVPYLVRKRVFS